MLIKYLIFATWLLIASCTVNPLLEQTAYYQKETLKPYDDVLAELQIAISEQNFRITGHSRVGKVIRNRGSTGFPDYDTLQFCNLTHARKLLSLSPQAVRYMPCNVVTYFYQGKTIVNVRLLPTDSKNPELNLFAKEMNKKMKQIVDFAVEE